MTDGQRLANLEQKVESHDRHIGDLCRSIEALHALIDEARLEQIRRVVRSGSDPSSANGRGEVVSSRPSSESI